MSVGHTAAEAVEEVLDLAPAVARFSRWPNSVCNQRMSPFLRTVKFEGAGTGLIWVGYLRGEHPYRHWRAVMTPRPVMGRQALEDVTLWLTRGVIADRGAR